MSIISSIMIRAFMISISSSQIRLLFRTLAATIPTADRTGLLSAEKCRRHLSAGTDSGRADVFYHIATSCSSPSTAPPGIKRLQKSKKPTCHGEALAETEACLPVAAHRREAEARFAKLKRFLGSLKMSRIYNLLTL